MEQNQEWMQYDIVSKDPAKIRQKSPFLLLKTSIFQLLHPFSLQIADTNLL